MKLTARQRKMLKDGRVRKGLTQQQAAKKAKMRTTYWCAIELGLRHPGLEAAKKMFKVVGHEVNIEVT